MGGPTLLFRNGILQMHVQTRLLALVNVPECSSMFGTLNDFMVWLRQLVSVALWLVSHHRRNNNSQSPDDGMCDIYHDDALPAGKPYHMV